MDPNTSAKMEMNIPEESVVINLNKILRIETGSYLPSLAVPDPEKLNTKNIDGTAVPIKFLYFYHTNIE